MAHTTSNRLYSLALVISGFWVNLLIHGIIYTPGVFYVIFLQELHYDHPPQVALSTSLHSAVVYGSGPICSMMIHSLGCRPVGILGGFISGAGLILAVFNRHVSYISFMFGVVTGLGMGMSYMANTVMISLYFTTYRSLVFAIANSAIGIGAIVYPLLLTTINWHYGWKGTLLIIGAVSLNLVACAAIYRQPAMREDRLAVNKNDIHNDKPPFAKKDHVELYVKRTRRSDTCSTILKKVFADTKIFRNRGYVLLCISVVFICLGISSLYVHLAAFTKTRGIDENNSALLFSMIGVGNFCGQLLTGALQQLPQCTGYMTLTAGFTNVGIMVLLLTVAQQYALFMAIAVAIGLGCGSLGISLLDIVVRLLGVDMVNGGFGYLLLFMALGQGIGGPLAGVIYEGTGQYTSSMYFGGGLLVIGANLLVPDLIKSCRAQTSLSSSQPGMTELGDMEEGKI